MSNCSNCYTGCTEIVSDKCIKYTGVDVPVMDIKKGDSLSFVEQALITFLGSTLDGSGIKLNIDESIYCTLVSQYLDACSEVTALALFKALIKAACDLQAQVDAVEASITTLEADYTIGCLDGVVASSNTHLIVQAIITKLCTINTSLTALAIDVDSNYVKISEINAYIAAYLASIATANRYYTRMVPYAVVEYYGSLSYFDGTGKGIPATEWENIYLCNGQNGTPDKRGRIPIGAINGVPGGALASAVNPASNPTFNPNYALGDVAGANSVVLTTAQLPSHNHSASTTISPNPHRHEIVGSNTSSFAGNGAVPAVDPASIEAAGYTEYTALSAGTTIGNTGSSQAHDNKPPVLACYYIMYIP